MTNISARDVWRRLEATGEFKDGERADITTFVSLRSTKEKREDGAFSWMMLSRDRTVLFGSKEIASVCKTKIIKIDTKRYAVSPENRITELEKRYIKDMASTSKVTSIVEIVCDV